jgi:hypothetical protein
MSHARHPMDGKMRKKANKEVKRGQKNLLKPDKQPCSDTLTVEKELKRYPKKIVERERSLLTTLKKNMQIKKKKAGNQNISKRTTPGTVEGQPSSPAYPHVEGGRWNKTLNLQNKMKGRAIATKLNKKR